MKHHKGKNQNQYQENLDESEQNFDQGFQWESSDNSSENPFREEAGNMYGRTSDQSIPRGQGKGSGNQGRNRQSYDTQGSRRSNSPLSEMEIEALQDALMDEYHALWTYTAVMQQFGSIEPFASIAISEQNHIDALSQQFSKNGLMIPDNTWLTHEPVNFESIEQACLAAVKAETENAALYDELFTRLNDPSLVRVFSNLQRASLENHLPSFETCDQSPH